MLYRNPTPRKSDLLQEISWPLVDSVRFSYVNINETLEIKNHPKEKSYNFWSGLYEKYNDPNRATFPIWRYTPIN